VFKIAKMYQHWNKRIRAVSLISILCFLIFIVLYETPPKQIGLRSVDLHIGNLKITGIAKDLIIQKVTKEGIWATRGYNIYFKPVDDSYFYRKGKVPVPLGISYILKSRIIRLILNKQEVLDLAIGQSKDLVAIGGGYIFQSPDSGRDFKIVYQIDHYGFGEGRGVMPQGYAVDKEGNFFWGEYWRNPNQSEVRVYKSKDGGITWKPSFEFSNGEIHHIHAVQYDPFFDAVWVATGDQDKSCQIMYSMDGGISFKRVGSGSQKWRACSLIFDEESVYWGMDGNSDRYPEPLIWRWDRKSKETETVAVLDSYAFYSTKLLNGTLVLSTDGTNGSASLWHCNDSTKWFQTVSWDRKRMNHFGNIRMASRDNDLVISNINLKCFNNDLLILSFH